VNKNITFTNPKQCIFFLLEIVKIVVGINCYSAMTSEHLFRLAKYFKLIVSQVHQMWWLYLVGTTFYYLENH